MKKLFSLLTLALLTMSAWAEKTVTFDLTTQGYTNQQEVTTLTSDGVTITFGKGTNSNAPKWFDNGSSVRVYGGNTITVTTEGNDPITGVTFTYGSSDGNNAITCDVGTFSSPTWAGSTETVVFTIGGTSGHRRFTKIEVTVGGEVAEIVADPIFTPNGGKFAAPSVTISLSCDTEGAAIYYTEGDTITDVNGATLYNAPFIVSDNKTYTAIARKNNVLSNPKTVTFTKVDPIDNTFIPIFYDAVNNGEFTITKDDVTLYCSSGSITTDEFRLYKDSEVKFTSAGNSIVKIEFTCTANNSNENGPGNLKLGENQPGSYDFEGKIGTWTGNATSVIFTPSAQTRCSQITFTLDDGTVIVVEAPTIPASQNFDNSITVEITNNAEGATLKYNIGEGWTDYTTALTFTETTTLQAKAVKGELESTVVTATYTKNEPTQAITTLAQANVLADGTGFTFAGDAVVTAQKDNYLWLRDASGYGLIFGNGVGEFVNGQVLSQNWTATKTTFRGLIEYQDAANLSASGVTNTALAAAQEITSLSEDMMNAYVMVKNVTSFTTNGKNVTANFEDGTTMVMYNQFSIEVPTTEGNYTVEGAIGKYNTNLQLYIISIKGYVPEEHNVNSIAEAYALPENATFTMFDEMVVTYQNGNRLWIRDSEGTSGMIYGDLGLENALENGQVLTDGWSATYAIYNNVPEFTNPEGVEPDGTNTREAAPYERAAITSDNVNEYIIMKGLTLLPDANNAKRFYNATDSLVIFNSFNVEIPEVEEGKTYDVTGIVTIYYGAAQVYITEMTEAAAEGLRGDVNDDKAVNISDVTALIDLLLGGGTITNPAADCNLDSSVNISDVTALIDFLLSGTWPANE